MIAKGVVFCALLAAGSWFLLKPESAELPPSTPNIEAPPAVTRSDELKPVETVATKPVNAVAKKPATKAAAAPISAEDKAVIDRILAAATKALEQSELQRSKRLQPFENELKRSERVLVQAPTNEQLSPIYSVLSEGSRVFPPDSAAGIAFRKRADGLVADLLRYPMKVVLKDLDKQAGTTSVQLLSMNQHSTFTETENGGFKVTGATRSGGVTDQRKVDYLFPDSNDQK